MTYNCGATAPGTYIIPARGLGDEELASERAVINWIKNAVDWVVARGYRNVLIEFRCFGVLDVDPCDRSITLLPLRNDALETDENARPLPGDRDRTIDSAN